MLTRRQFYGRSLRAALGKAWASSGVASAILALLIPATLYVEPSVGKHRIFVGWWISVADFSWLVPSVWLIAFALFATIPAIYSTYSSESEVQRKESEELRSQLRVAVSSLKRPRLILTYGQDPAANREQREVLVRNIGEGHSREVTIDSFSIGRHDGEFETLQFIESDQVAALPFTAHRDREFGPMFGHDFYHLAEKRLEELQPSFQDREVAVVQLTLRYKDVSGTDFASEWSAVMDVMFTAADDRDRALTFREHGIARAIPASREVVQH